MKTIGIIFYLFLSLTTSAQVSGISQIEDMTSALDAVEAEIIDSGFDQVVIDDILEKNPSLSKNISQESILAEAEMQAQAKSLFSYSTCIWGSISCCLVGVGIYLLTQ